MRNATDENESWMIADIGATNSRCAVFDPQRDAVTDLSVNRNREFESLADLLKIYLEQLRCRPDKAALAIAAPIVGDAVQMVNCDWHFERDSLARDLGLERLELLNDYHAVACALPWLTPEQVAEIGSTRSGIEATRAVLGPGSGLGMAAWIGNRDSGCVMTGEGGHTSLAARNDLEESIIRKIRDRYGHCSAERVLSGPGIIDLYEAMHGVRPATSEEVTEHCDDERCAGTMQQFFSFLGSVAADLALVCGAFGGIYIGGGIVPACLEQIQRSSFRARFEDKNRYRSYMQSIPTYVITDRVPGLTGLAALIKRDLTLD